MINERGPAGDKIAYSEQLSERGREYQYRILDNDNRQRGDYIYRLLGRKPRKRIFDSNTGNTNLTQLGKDQKASTEECMRYIIYYLQNVDNILAWKIIHNRLLG